MKKKFLSIVLTAALTATLFAGCGDSAADNTNGNQSAEPSTAALEDGIEGTAVTERELDNEIHIAISAAPSTLDCNMTSAVVTKQIAYSNIFESLLTMKSDFSVACELAESYEVSDDNTVYTYYLRKGVLFHNGQEMKAADVVASMNRWIDNYGNAASLVGDARFEEVDDYTVQITLDTPSIFLNELIAGAGNTAIIFPASSLDSVDPDTGMLTEYIGTGPYKYDDWVTDQYIKLTKFDDYVPYGTNGEIDGYAGYKEAAVETVYYDFVPENSTRISGLQTGEYDFAYRMPTDNYEQFDGQSDYIIYKEVAGYPALVYNKKAGIASNPTFRQAVNAGLNCEDILLTMYADPAFYRLDGSLMIKEQAQWYTEAGTENYNVNNAEKAQSLLQEAGYNGEPFTILVTTDYQEFYDAAIIIQQQLQAIGIDCEVDACDWSTFLEKRADETKYDAFITTFSTNALPTQLSFYNPEWAGWTSDEEVIQGVADFYAAGSLEDAISTWNDLQQFTLTDGQEISKFGDYQLYSVSTAKVAHLAYFQGPLVWSAEVYK